MPVTEIAFASGFASVRQFNASFREAYGRPPTALRARVPRPRRAGPGPACHRPRACGPGWARRMTGPGQAGPGRARHGRAG